jgi:diguanylate cyclase (GGDEF)-like protein
MDGLARDRLAPVRNYVPFALAALLAWISEPLTTSVEWREYAVAAALLALCGLGRALLRRGHWRIVPSLLFLAALGLLRDAGGGISSGVSTVAIVPVFYIALHSQSRRDLYTLLAGLAVFYIAPILIVGPPDYPHTQYRTALLAVAVSSIVGVATQRLVAAVRERAAESRERERMLGELSGVVRGLLASEHAREDVCLAARTIGRASVAVLFEPIEGEQAMRASAFAGPEQEGVSPERAEVSLARTNAVRTAFRSGRSVLLADAAAADVGSVELWTAAGRPRTVIYEPLLRGAEAIGVLVVGWPSEVHADGPRIKVVELLAHEAAAVLTRADAFNALSEKAHTDSLTGLPNRRAWDARLAEALRDGSRFTVAMLDFDHFKQYNDTHGHAAGDRLLKETAAMWREHVRAGDLLARLGGEEFGVLLLDCHPDRARAVIERLRGAVYHDRTCSAGFAVHHPGERAEQVMARADAALYEAKESGRNRICMSTAQAEST